MEKIDYRKAWGQWLAKFYWDFFATFTFKLSQFPHKAMRKFHSFIKGINGKANFFVVVEKDIPKKSVHIHALLGNMGDTSSEHIRKAWKKKYGIAQVLPYDVDLGASHYVTKYIHRDEADYDISLDYKMKTVKEEMDKITARRKPYCENRVLKGYRIQL